MHALIIEDEVSIAGQIQEYLRFLGYSSADIAVTEAEAVDAASMRRPDLITADYALLQGTGVGAVAKICQYGAIPVVYIVGNPWNLQWWLDAPVVLEKPINLGSLATAIKTACMIAAPSHAPGDRNLALSHPGAGFNVHASGGL